MYYDMDDKRRLGSIKGLMRRLLKRNQHTTLRGQASERAAHAQHQRPKSMTPFDHQEYEAWQKELDRMDREGPGRSDD